MINREYMEKIPEVLREDVLEIIKQDNSKFAKEGYEKKLERTGRLANFYYDKMNELKKSFGKQNNEFAYMFLNYLAYYSFYNSLVDGSIDKIESFSKRMKIREKRRNLTKRVQARFFDEAVFKKINNKEN